MPSERRYNEKEIAEIFKQAAEDQEAAERLAPEGGGLTLAEIERIGKETGITPEFIAQAAAKLESKPRELPAGRFLGVPVSVDRTIDVSETFSEKDWDLLVTDLHEHFNTPGNSEKEGSRWRWFNGHMHVLAEPHAEGYRIHFRSHNAPRKGLMAMSTIFFVMGLFFMLMLGLKGDLFTNMAKTVFVSMFSVAGLAAFGGVAATLPGLRRRQGSQIDQVIRRILERTDKTDISDGEGQGTEEGIPLLDLEEAMPDPAAEPVVKQKNRS